MLDSAASSKRRRLPPSFDLAARRHLKRREISAVRLQRFWRWRRSLPGCDNVIGSEELLAGTALRLVEPDGFCCCLHGPSLAEHYLRSLSFRHPLTGRALTPPELRRLERKVAPSMRGALRATRLLREELRRWLSQEDVSEQRIYEEEAGEALQQMLEVAERGGYASMDYVAMVLMGDYEDSMHRLGGCSLRALETTASLHAQTAARRGFFWPPRLQDELLRVHADVLRNARSWAEACREAEDSDAQWQLLRYLRFLQRL